MALIVKTLKDKYIISKSSNGWITVKRHHDNEEETGRHLFIKEGETPKEAMKRQWGVDLDKRGKEESQQPESKEPKSYDDRKKSIEAKEKELESKYGFLMPFSKNGFKKLLGAGKKAEDMYNKHESIYKSKIDYMNGEDKKGDEYLQGLEESLKDIKDYREKRHNKKEQKEESIKKADFETLRETPKALQIKKDGRTFWVKKQWVDKNGQLTPRGMMEYDYATDEATKQKIAEEKEKNNPKVKEIEEKWRKKRDEGIPLPQHNWESEKCYGYDISIDFYDMEQTRNARVFVPKSMVKDGKVPVWFIEKQIDSALSKYDNYSQYGGWEIENNPFSIIDKWRAEELSEIASLDSPEASKESERKSEVLENYFKSKRKKGE